MAAATLAAPLGQQGGAEAGEERLVNIQEEYDEALHGPLQSHPERQESPVQASAVAAKPPAGVSWHGGCLLCGMSGGQIHSRWGNKHLIVGHRGWEFWAWVILGERRGRTRQCQGRQGG